MLKLIYDVRCGFKQLYMTETHLEYELDGLFLNLDEESFNGFKSAKDFYGYCKDLSQAEQQPELSLAVSGENISLANSSCIVATTMDNTSTTAAFGNGNKSIIDLSGYTIKLDKIYTDTQIKKY